MKAISLWQPWATLIAIGAKRCETRSWETRYRGPVAIHASKKWTRELGRIASCGPHRAALEDAGLDLSYLRCANTSPTATKMIPLGAIVATARIVACLPTPREIPHRLDPITVFDPRRLPTADPMAYSVSADERMFGDYSPGRWVWVLESISPLDMPIPYRGAQGLFEIPDTIFVGGAS